MNFTVKIFSQMFHGAPVLKISSSLFFSNANNLADYLKNTNKCIHKTVKTVG